MTDWQKVRVTFNDADGNEVSAVMWQLNEYQTCAYLERNHEDVGAYLAWAKNDKRVKIEPIRELPTGVGAVIRATSYGDGSEVLGDDSDVWIRNVDGLWTNCEADYVEPGDDWQYKILSEGIQL